MENTLDFKTRNIAITDLETTGLDPLKHEIIEIGLVLISQPELEIIETLDIKVKPEHIETATPEALQINGYRKEDWGNAVSLQDALSAYLKKATGALFCAYNIGFDLPFIKQACVRTNIPLTLDQHCIDIPTLVWSNYRTTKLERMKLSIVAQYLGLDPEPEVHRAINGAMLAYEVLKKITDEEEEGHK